MRSRPRQPFPLPYNEMQHKAHRLATFRTLHMDSSRMLQLAEQGLYFQKSTNKLACAFCSRKTHLTDENIHRHNDPLLKKSRQPIKPEQTLAIDEKTSTTSTCTITTQENPNSPPSCSPIEPSISPPLTESEFQHLNSITLPFLLSNEVLDSSPSTSNNSPPSPINLDDPPSTLQPLTLNDSANIVTTDTLLCSKHPLLRTLTARLNTFTHWPVALTQDPLSLSYAGFFYTQLGDMITCFSCGGTLKGWQPDSKPWHEHAMYFPNCTYLKMQKGPSFIEKTRSDYQSNLVFCRKQDPISDTPSPTTSPTSLCSICITHPVHTAFIPCGHAVSCASCVFSLTTCPLCRTPFHSVLRIFT